MRNQHILYGVIGLLAGSLITVFLTTNAVNSNNFGVMQMMGVRRGVNSVSTINNLDKHFIEQMIPHHEGAIDMAKLAKERSKLSEILTLSDSIIQSQSDEINQMKQWYKNWYGSDVTTNSNVNMGMGRGMMQGGMMGGNTSDLEVLRNSSNFDRSFLQEMIPHHQMAVMMAQMLLRGTSRSEMKELAQNIIAAQEKEIEQMRSWLSNLSE